MSSYKGYSPIDKLSYAYSSISILRHFWDIYHIDPAFILTIVNLKSRGNFYYKEFMSFVWSYYLSSSDKWIQFIEDHNYLPEDISSCYGIYALPYLTACSYGFKGKLTDLYNIKITEPYVAKYIRKLIDMHKQRSNNLIWAIVNYGYPGFIGESTKNKFGINFDTKYKRCTKVYYTAVKSLRIFTKGDIDGEKFEILLYNKAKNHSKNNISNSQ